MRTLALRTRPVRGAWWRRCKEDGFPPPERAFRPGWLRWPFMTVPRCVVVGVDTSPESLAALDLALELAGGLDARLIAVHAVGLLEAGGYRNHPDLAAIVEEARQRVGPGVRSSVDPVVDDGVPADVVLRVAEREGADLIVVGSRGLGGALRQLGSTSEALVTRSVVPVLVVPGAER